MTDFQPIGRLPTPSEAIDHLQAQRARLSAAIDGLSDRQMKAVSVLGGGEWSIHDLLGHLASCESTVVALLTGQPLPAVFLELSMDDRNAAEVARKRGWTVRRVRDESNQVRAALIQAIDAAGDDHWRDKVPIGGGRRSALGLVAGRILSGGRFGLFAHDMDHMRDLERSIRARRE
jgi:hypothetical protein